MRIDYRFDNRIAGLVQAIDDGAGLRFYDTIGEESSQLERSDGMIPSPPLLPNRGVNPSSHL